MKAAPAINEVEVSLFGPGYGECLVIHLGGADWLIVDSCLNQQRLPVSIDYLAELGIDAASNVRLIVATHWHDDHVRGLSKIFKVADSAEFVVSTAMRTSEFITLVNVMQSNAMMSETGVKEWSEILDVIKKRKTSKAANYKPAIFAVGNKRIFQRPANPLTDVKACEVWVLSPSDESVAHSLAAFAELFPKTASAKNQIRPLGPNHTSIVLWIQYGDLRILLGADLENTPSPHSGWNVIANSSNKPNGQAGLFKIPHHGSENGHNLDVWKKMLIDKPIGIVSPFLHGKKALPTTTDATRITALTSSSYITTSAIPAKDKRKTQGALDKTIAETVKSIRNVPLSTGHIRMRAKDGESWKVDLFGTAKELKK